jgi:hypothetical protein
MNHSGAAGTVTCKNRPSDPFASQAAGEASPLRAIQQVKNIPLEVVYVVKNAYLS